MKKFGFTLMSLLLVCCFMFVGCSGTATLNYKVNKNNEVVNHKTQTVINLGEDVEMSGAITDRGNVIVTKTVDSTDYFGVFNLLENKMVVDFVEESSDLQYALISTEHADYIKAYDGGVDSLVAVYDLTQVLNTTNYFLEGMGPLQTYSFEQDGVVYETWQFDNRTLVYKYNNKGRVLVDVLESSFGLNYDEVVPAASLFGKAGEDKYIKSEVLGNGNVLVNIYKLDDNGLGEISKSYVIDLNNVQAVLKTVDYTNFKASLGSQGRYVIMQKFIEKDMMGKNYDLLVEGLAKADVETIRLDLLTGKTKTIKCKYVFDSASLYSMEDGIAVVSDVCKIENKNLVEKVAAVVDLKSGKVNELDRYYTNVVELAEDRYLADNKHIIDSKFNVVVDLEEYTIVGYSNEMMAVTKDNKYTTIDFNGKTYASDAFEVDELIGVYNNQLLKFKHYVNCSFSDDNVLYDVDIYSSEAFTIEVRYNADERKCYINDQVVGDVLSMSFANGMVYTTSTSATVGNLVYTFYAADGTQVGQYDIKAGVPMVRTFGENNSHAYMTIGETIVLCY